MSIPLLIHLRIPTENSSCGLWLPWFLIYPIVLVMMLIVLPFILVAAVILLPLGIAGPLIMAFPYLWRVLFSMRGLNIAIQTGDRDILINFV